MPAPASGQTAKEAYAADLRAQIARLQVLLVAVESEGETLLDPSSGSAVAAPVHSLTGSPVRPDSFFGMSVPQATKKFLQMMGKGNPQGPTAIADALIAGGLESAEKRTSLLNNIYTAFGRAPDEFQKVGKLWGLKEWYGDRTAAKLEAPAAKKKGKKRGKRRASGAVKASRSQQSQTALRLEVNPDVSMGWRAFLAKAMDEGKTMQQAGAEWRARKQG